MSDKLGQLSKHQHAEILNEEILNTSNFLNASNTSNPRAIILAGQPGAGKGSLKSAARLDLSSNVVIIDPDDLRRYHPDVTRFQAESPYNWADFTHPDASEWARELRDAAVAARKNVIVDGTLSNAESAVKLIGQLQAQGYQGGSTRHCHPSAGKRAGCQQTIYQPCGDNRPC